MREREAFLRDASGYADQKTMYELYGELVEVEAMGPGRLDYLPYTPFKEAGGLEHLPKTSSGDHAIGGYADWQLAFHIGSRSGARRLQVT